MDLTPFVYPSGLLPAAPVAHGYRNFWIRDGYYVGLCDPTVRASIWNGMIDILDRYRWKLEIHAKKAPIHWFEHIHIRYSPEGEEITNEHWSHHQWDSIGNWLDVCIDAGRADLAELLVDYLYMVQYQRKPAAGAWEDRNSSDAYSLAACISALQQSKSILTHKCDKIDGMVKKGMKRLTTLLPYATCKGHVCLSLLGIIWPFNLAGPYKDEIVALVKSQLMREPYGFIRYLNDEYNGEYMNRGKNREVPWLLGDLFFAKIEPENPIWLSRLDRAQNDFGCMPEAYFPETMKPNRNTPLFWAQAMWNSIRLQYGNK